MNKQGYNIAFIISAFLMITGCSTVPKYSEIKPLHHTTNGFRNFPLIFEDTSKGFAFYYRRIWDSFNLPKEVPPEHYLSEKDAIIQYNQLKSENTLTWLGHSTFLIKINGKTILTDPFLTKFASPYEPFGARRFVSPGISLENLPNIDLMIISHNHYDHLDIETAENLRGKESVHVIVPLGLKKFFKKIGYKNIYELDWGTRKKFDNIEIIALPAVHYSGRGLFDKNKSLWCSWAIIVPSGNYFFTGDTGYSPSIFKEIGDKFNYFNLAIVPIGAYEPKSLQKYHLTPEQALKIGMDLNASNLVAMHWGTIKLSDEDPWEPPKLFFEKANEMGISKKRIWIQKIGETRILP